MTFSFGSKPATAGGFGGFGAAATSQPSATGFGGFGAAATSQPGAAGFGGFGAAAANTQSTGFGGFGTTNTATQQNTGFGGFGAGATATTQQNNTFGGFGANSSKPASFGGFGTTTSQPSTAFGGFGTSTAQQPASTAFGGFGGAAKPAQPTFGFGGATAGTTQAAGGGTFGGFSGFGANNQTQTNTFGGLSGFGAGAANKPTGFGGSFGGNTGGGGLFGGGAATNTFNFQGQQQLQQQQQQQQANPVEELFNSVLHCSLFGDERDALIARWNMLQASWGVGKAYYSNNAQPIAITPENPFCRFKSIGYSALPKYNDKDGLVSLAFKKKVTELESGKAALITSISGVLGNKPNIKVSVNSMKATGADTAEAVVVIEESAPNGQVRKVPATEMSTFLNQPAQAQNLKTLGVEMVIPKTSISDSDLKDYLATPPKGIDPRLWKQAQDDNPNPKVYIPVPLLGFKSVMQRIKLQEDQAKAHQGRLDCIADDISSLQKKHQATVAALEEAKRRQLELSHRVLKVLVRQESTRKHGFTITPEEERLRSQLETIQTKLETPTQFKGKLNELLSQVRLQSQSSVLSGSNDKYALDQFAVADIKSVLKDQQQAIQALVQIVKTDLKDLNVMVEGLSTASQP
eukprot:TRINITY_DN370_c0_g1_i6.p1 TRINITY_DN370_c0_g1~~TRINITY_DN370_c0_g1_i6.p1  ORF type:complete len:633 (-),score=194.92 TRINITY_DN370_c0_g1_i6:154-2052(-)